MCHLKTSFLVFIKKILDFIHWFATTRAMLMELVHFNGSLYSFEKRLFTSITNHILSVCALLKLPALSIFIFRRIRFRCWISKATNTHSQYVTITAFPQQQWLHKRTLKLRQM